MTSAQINAYNEDNIYNILHVVLENNDKEEVVKEVMRKRMIRITMMQ